jgi:hypothetical protein
MAEHFDEALKGEADVARSHAHFDTVKDDKEFEAFQGGLTKNFYSIPDKVLEKDVREKLLEFLADGPIEIQIPAWNEEDTLPAIVEYLTKQTGDKGKVLVMDADSTDKTAEVARAAGAKVVTQSDMYECIDMDAMRDVLGDPKPRGRGMTLYAFWLYRFLVQEGAPKYAVYSDSDIRNFPEYDPMPFMAYPLVFDEKKDFNYFKIAKPGRNNETVMGARTTIRAVSPLGKRYFDRLSRDMWMISGEYGYKCEPMKNLPHCTRSFVDTYTAMYFADLERQKPDSVAIISCPNSRIDKKNDPLKEQTILYSIACNIVGTAVYDVAVADLTMENIKELNTTMFPQFSYYPFIPEDVHAPMQSVHIMNDRVIPSVQQIIDAGWLKKDKVATMKEKYAGYFK